MSEEKWSHTFPKKPGVYKCRINGEREEYLINHLCQLNGRFRWKDLRGVDYDHTAYVEWTGDPLGPTNISG